MTAFEQGYEAHAKGVPREENPFEKEKTPKSMVNWDKGWAARARTRS